MLANILVVCLLILFMEVFDIIFLVIQTYQPLILLYYQEISVYYIHLLVSWEEFLGLLCLFFLLKLILVCHS